MRLMSAPTSSESPYRVTLFFGPEPVDASDIVACVFNVKKRSWKAGVQVSVEITTTQLSAIDRKLRVTERVSEALQKLDPADRQGCEARVPDLFAQAVSWCKLDLRLGAGLPQHNQQISADEFLLELEEAVVNRQEYVVAYILTELDQVPHVQ
jgi:hypothetical protein